MSNESKSESNVSLSQIQEAVEAERQSIIENLTQPKQGDQFSSAALVVANRARREWESVALRWRDKNRKLERELRDLQATLELIHAADLKAATRWRMSHPGQEYTYPSRNDLLAWCLNQLDRKEACLESQSQEMPMS